MNENNKIVTAKREKKTISVQEETNEIHKTFSKMQNYKKSL